MRVFALFYQYNFIKKEINVINKNITGIFIKNKKTASLSCETAFFKFISPI